MLSKRYFEQFFHVKLDIWQCKLGIDFSKILMLEVLKDVAGGPEVCALDDIEYFDDIGMIKLFEDVVLSFDFGGLDGRKHFDGHLLFCFYVLALEDVRVPATAHLMRNCIVLQLAE